MNPDLNLFMMCPRLNRAALRPLPSGYHLRRCRPEELPVWMDFPFDDSTQAQQGRPFMEQYVQQVYDDHFFNVCLFLCDSKDRPVATCFSWKAYGQIQTIHWFKTLKAEEGKGLGRALLSAVMEAVPADEYPVFLHTQSGSFRAIKLYTDFGFQLLRDPQIGSRPNQLAEALPVLQQVMEPSAFAQLSFADAPAFFLKACLSSPISQF